MDVTLNFYWAVDVIVTLKISQMAEARWKHFIFTAQVQLKIRKESTKGDQLHYSGIASSDHKVSWL